MNNVTAAAAPEPAFPPTAMGAAVAGMVVLLILACVCAGARMLQWCAPPPTGGDARV